jgi:tetratricopeptide (TPR) repeat protein
VGRFQEAIAEAKRAVELDPLSPVINSGLGAGFLFARQYDQAIEQERKTLEMDPNFRLAQDSLAFAYVQKSMYKEAIAEFEKLLASSPDNAGALGGLGYTYAVAGRKAEARKVLDRLTELSKREYVPAIFVADVHVGLGEKDKAFEWLEKGFEERSLMFTKVDPMFDPLRSDPRFADLLRRMNLQP